MISAFSNTFKIPELRSRIIFTLILLVVVRVGAVITCPGVNAAVLQEWFSTQVSNDTGGNAAALFNIFSGGALENCAVFSLGVMPYISASIMLQLLTAVVPSLGKLSKEDGGRQKIMQYTRYATIALCIFQGYLLALTFENPANNPFLHGIMDTIKKMGIPLVSDPGIAFRVMTVLTLTAGTMFLMWVGDQITDRGVGNGMSMIITVGIVARLPAGLMQAWRTFVPTAGKGAQVQPIVLVAMLAFLIIVIAAVICVTQAQRKISVQYAKRVVGQKVYGGQTQYMPLKVNYAGVMPIIFAQALLVFPSTIASTAFKTSPLAQNIAAALTHGWIHYTVYAAMIFFFSYFWVATQFQPQQIAEDLKKYGGYVPGVRPGKPTADFLDFTMTRLTFAGAIFLTIIAILPGMLSERMNVPYITAQFFGGTSLLIIVGVILDTMRQVETHLIQRHYDGFLRKGRIRGRSSFGPTGGGEAVKENAMLWLYVVIAILFIAGMVIFVASRFQHLH
ncbi:preprotein translocase, SecY subunit [Chthoniobacter flavus Ellin428]|uniref:Protein translocase subunit SecY n=1 Tax=Chthoniobacter flavus Ellin428 TaxID=497964 RepID=B4CUZ2_9BACT|nr:preprotein translocase subunit SecY [Chthoniobacter flavus]EDY22380.1 preprotein translocase, SecY subunit [Chthoniobacter flavus Ellin428]TCO94607.1 protein translocase subunit secY/sec61 alpha [Chthoniobacter flavus]